MRIPGTNIHIYRPGSRRGDQAQQLQQALTTGGPPAGAPANPGTAAPPPRHATFGRFTIGRGLRDLTEQARTQALANTQNALQLQNQARINAHNQAQAFAQNQIRAEGLANARRQALDAVRNQNAQLDQQNQQLQLQLQQTLRLLQQAQVQNTHALTQVNQLTQDLARLQAPPSVDASTSTDPPPRATAAVQTIPPTMVNVPTMTGVPGNRTVTFADQIVTETPPDRRPWRPTVDTAAQTENERLPRDVMDALGMQLFALAQGDVGTLVPVGWATALARFLRVDRELAGRFTPAMRSLRLEHDLVERQAGAFNFDRLPDLMGLYENGRHGPAPLPHALMNLPARLREGPLSRIINLLSGQNGRAHVRRFAPQVMTALRSLPPDVLERTLTAGIARAGRGRRLPVDLARHIIGLGGNAQPGSVASLPPERRARPLDQFLVQGLPTNEFTFLDWRNLRDLIRTVPAGDELRGRLDWLFQRDCPFFV